MASQWRRGGLLGGVERNWSISPVGCVGEFKECKKSATSAVTSSCVCGNSTKDPYAFWKQFNAPRTLKLQSVAKLTSTREVSRKGTKPLSCSQAYQAEETAFKVYDLSW